MPRKPIEAPAPDDEPVAAGGEEDVVEMNYTANFGDAENYEGVDMDDLAEFVDLGDEAEEEATAAATANTDGVELVTVRPLAKSLQLQPGGGVAQMDAEAADELPQVIERVAAHGTEMGLNKQERLGYIKVMHGIGHVGYVKDPRYPTCLENKMGITYSTPVIGGYSSNDHP